MSNINSKIYILGLSCFYHDSAACLIGDGNIWAAAHEELYIREKHDSGFPKNRIINSLMKLLLNLNIAIMWSFTKSQSLPSNGFHA